MVDHAAVVAVGVATGVGAVLGAPSATQASVEATASRPIAPTAAPAARPHAPNEIIRPSAACPGTPTDGRTVRSADLVSVYDSTSVVGQVYLEYSPSLRCVRSIVGMYGDHPDCLLHAIVHKDSTGENTSSVQGAYGTSIVVSDWVTDADIQQRAVGLKSCQNTPGGAIVATGSTSPY